MKSDHWLLGKIVEESLTKRDIAHLRKLLANGHSDEEALKALVLTINVIAETYKPDGLVGSTFTH